MIRLCFFILLSITAMDDESRQPLLSQEDEDSRDRFLALIDQGGSIPFDLQLALMQRGNKKEVKKRLENFKSEFPDQGAFLDRCLKALGD